MYISNYHKFARLKYNLKKYEKWKEKRSYYVHEEINIIYDDVWATLCYGKTLIVWIFLILMRHSFIKLYFKKKLSWRMHRQIKRSFISLKKLTL